MARQGSAPEVVLGIDLGTTKSVMAAFLEDDVEVLQNDIGSRSTPSCVHASMDAGDDVRDVGEAALRLAVSHPHSTVRNVKSVLGRAYQDVGSDHQLGPIKLSQSNSGHGVSIYLEGGAVMAAEEVASMLLVHLKKAAEEQLGRGDINNAVIAVPAYFNAAQRHSVLDAAYLAGLRVPLLVNDTSAAALVYARERDQSKTVLVVDVGGGGSSVAVVQTEAGCARVLAASGRRLPGGEDFDARMVDYFKEVIKQTHGVEVTTARSQEILRGQWEKAKQKLSRIPSTKMATFLPDGDLDFQADVSRAVFEELCRPLFQAIVDELKRTLLKAKVAVNQVDDVVLVGGSSRIPALRAMVQTELAQRPVCKAVSADEAVAKGAALLAAQCVRLHEVTPLVLKVLAAGKEVVVDANTALPFVRPMPGTSHVMVRQGCLDELGGGHSSLVTIYETKKKIPLEAVQFGIDSSGTFRFLDGSGGSLQFYIRGCLSSAVLRDMRSKVESRIQGEEADRERIEVKNELEERCRAYLSQEQEVDHGDLDAELIRNLRRECEEDLQWLDANPSASLDKLLGNLASLTGRWEDLKDSRNAREAERRREDDRVRAEKRRVDMLRRLEERCVSYLDQEPEAAESDPDAAEVWKLRSECEGHLRTLEANRGASYDELDTMLTSVTVLHHELQESRERRRIDADRQREVDRQKEREVDRQRQAEAARARAAAARESDVNGKRQAAGWSQQGRNLYTPSPTPKSSGSGNPRNQESEKWFEWNQNAPEDQQRRDVAIDMPPNPAPAGRKKGSVKRWIAARAEDFVAFFTPRK